MSVFVATGIESGVYRAVNSHRIIELAIALANDSVNSLKSEARYLTQLKGILLENIDTLCSEMLVDLGSRCRRYTERGEQKHKSSKTSAFVIGSLDLFKLCRCDTSNFE